MVESIISAQAWGVSARPVVIYQPIYRRVFIVKGGDGKNFEADLRALTITDALVVQPPVCARHPYIKNWQVPGFSRRPRVIQTEPPTLTWRRLLTATPSSPK